MNLKGYVDFVEAFERLTPYELDHFSKLFFDNFNQLLTPQENKMGTIKRDDLRDVITQTMQDAHIEIAQKKIDEAKHHFDMIKSRLLVADENRS